MSVTINGRRETMEEEKQLAIEMWEFVRVCQIELCIEDDSLSLKRKFISMKLKCGIDIKWHNDCFLCNYCAACLDCPLYKIGDNEYCSGDDSPFDITMHPNDYQYYQIDVAISKIIEAIKEFNI